MSDGTIKHVGHGVDVSVFSFQAVKNLPTADSGMICFENPDYDKLARKLSWLGIDKDTYQRTNDKGTYKWEYDLVDIGFKYHGNSIMACMGIVGLKYLDVDNQRRRDICQMYMDSFDNHNIKYVKNHHDCEVPSRHLFQVITNNRNEIMNYLNTQGIYPGVHYRDNTHYSMYNYALGTCPFSQTISEKVISLPLHINLSDNDVEYVISKVVDAVSKFS